ncbi:YciI family protein [Peribacillus kribbensis]|uniref:YciI family protein n=1 Tax=Peribacillus kribbensis TaxID=356658 RepID=UPI0004030D0C|nr:YciI family protein [Peribacillus kribbensis]
MKYLCLGYFSPGRMNSRPKEEIEVIMGMCQRLLDPFYKSGQVLMDAGLEAGSKILKRMEGNVIAADGPAETGEIIGSAFLIEAENMDEAVRTASLHPSVQVDEGSELGWRIEIRPIHYFKSGLS